MALLAQRNLHQASRIRRPSIDPQAIINDLTRRGIRLIPEPPRLTVTPASKLTDDDRALIRAHKAELLDHLIARIARLDAERREADRLARRGYDFDPSALEPGRAAWPRSVTPDSRHPLIPSEVRAKIEAVEADARAKGWPPELLWNGNFWDHPRGLAAVLDSGDEIVEVSAECITILKIKRDVLRFRRHVG